MKVLWTHNFDPKIDNSGSFMHLLAQGVRELGIDLALYYLGNLRSPQNIFRGYQQVKQIASGYDLVHAQFGSACAVATCGAGKMPKVLSLRGSDWYRFKERMGLQAAHSLVATQMTRQVVKSYDSVLVMSHRMSEDVFREYPQAPVSVLPSPIDLNLFRPTPKKLARTKLGFPDNTDKWVLFTTMSTTNPIKRVSLALEAVHLANNRLGNVKLRVATGLDHADMPLFVSACDLALCTSAHEGWPNSIKEALACNIPFVATDVSDLALVAAQNPSCRICPPAPQVIADSICEVLCMPDYGNLRRHVAEMDVSETSTRLVRLYRELLSNR